MSYQVIARKYRPQRFADVVGQEHVTETLTNAIKQNRIAHAYLFCGPRGTGKTTIARIFAKCLNCAGGPRVDFDDADERVKEITEGRALDVLEIDGASNNGVEQVRELRETCQYAPASGKFKIYIIDEVHMLSTAAFNALLKTLEEPPAHVKFMFATTDPEKVLATILSRCQRFDLRRIPTSLIVKHLAEIAAKEKVEINDAALHAIARGADGGMRDAESTLDQLISFCGDKIEESDVLSMFGLAAQGQILELGRAVLAGETHAALHQLNDLAQKGKELGRLLSDLLAHYRNLILFQVSKGNLNLLEVSEQEADSLKEQATLASTEALTRILEVVADAELRLRDAPSKKILLEVTLLRAIEARSTMSIDALLTHLASLRGQGGGASTPGKTKEPVPASATPPPLARATITANPVTSPPPAPELQTPAAKVGNIIGEPLESLWSQVMDGIARASKFAANYLVIAHPVSFANGVLTVGYDPEFADQLGLADNSKNHALIQTKLAELGHPGAQIKFVIAEAPEGREKPALPVAPNPTRVEKPKPLSSASRKAAPPPTKEKATASVAFNKDEFKNDPLIQRALEIFKGQIVEVRS